MIKPTIQQVQEYADSIGFDLDVEYFIAKNDAIGWMVGSRKNAKPMVSWKGCVRTWHIAAKRRQKQAHNEAEATLKRIFRPHYEPTVFVQCTKGPTTGRYLPIIMKDSHLKDIPNEQYIAAAEEMCKKLNQSDGTGWVVRADVTERQLMDERGAIQGTKPFRPNYKNERKKGPLAMSKEIRKQVKKLEDDCRF